MRDKVRVGQPELNQLALACYQLRQAFGPCYLVGECLDRRDYRHVDVRMILPNEQFHELFGGRWDGGVRTVRWHVMCVSITKMLRDATGLPVDFQIQSESWSEHHFGDRRRVSIGDLEVP